MELPDELWKIIKDYQIEYKKHHINKLKNVHDELLKNRPMYLRKFIAYERITFEQALEFSWVNFVRDNKTIDAVDGSHYPKHKLHLHAIEIFPWSSNDRLFLSKPSFDVYIDDKNFEYKKNWINSFKKKYLKKN